MSQMKKTVVVALCICYLFSIILLKLVSRTISNSVLSEMSVLVTNLSVDKALTLMNGFELDSGLLTGEREPKISWEVSLKSRIQKVKSICGKICAVNDEMSFNEFFAMTNSNDGENSDFITQLDCNAIVNMKELDAVDYSIPYPRPSFLEKEFSMNGLVKEYFTARFNNSYLGSTAFQPNWKRSSIENLLKTIDKEGILSLEGTYGARCSQRILNEISIMGVRGLDVLVIGSEQPWIEVICLHLGARSITTLEYGNIITDHPKMRTLTPDELRQAFNRGNLTLFDRIISHSSVEHSGLGRYGDALNPWGDILTVMRAWCLSKAEALMYLSVPRGEDSIKHNLHRIYGKYRWPILTVNWLPIHSPNEKLDGMECGGQGSIMKKNRWVRRV